MTTSTTEVICPQPHKLQTPHCSSPVPNGQLGAVIQKVPTPQTEGRDEDDGSSCTISRGMASPLIVLLLLAILIIMVAVRKGEWGYPGKAAPSLLDIEAGENDRGMGAIGRTPSEEIQDTDHEREFFS